MPAGPRSTAPGCGDADNNATLLRQLDAVADKRRSARFVCVLAMADPQGQIVLTVRETMEGRISALAARRKRIRI